MFTDDLSLIRDPDKVISQIKEKGGVSYALTDIRIYFPEDYVNRGMSDIDEDVTFYGVCAIVADNKFFTTMAVPAKIRTQPTGINLVDMSDGRYFEFYYEPGSVVIKDHDVVQDMMMSYAFYELAVSLGRYPWYSNYLTPTRVFLNSLKYAGIAVGSNKAVSEIIVAVTAKSPNNHALEYRHTIKKKSDLEHIRPFFTPLGSVNQNATNTTAKLVGSRISEGITAALTNPSKDVEDIESLLRY